MAQIGPAQMIVAPNGSIGFKRDMSLPSFPRPVHAVIFDMDGLLLDTEKPIKAAMLAAAAAMNRPMDESHYRTLVGRNHVGIHAGLMQHFQDETLVQDFLARYRVGVQHRFAAGIALMAGADALLTDLSQRAMRRAVATSSPRGRARQHLDQAGIGHHFDHIVGGDDVSQGKPHPEPYLLAAARLGVDPLHCVALEDSLNGIRSAHAAGMMAIMVPDTVPPTDEIVPLCHHIAPDLVQVRAMLARVGGI